MNAIEDKEPFVSSIKPIYDSAYEVLWIVRFTERKIDLPSDVPEPSSQLRR